MNLHNTLEEGFILRDGSKAWPISRSKTGKVADAEYALADPTGQIVSQIFTSHAAFIAHLRQEHGILFFSSNPKEGLMN